MLKHPYVGSEHLLLAILVNDYLDVTKKLNITKQNVSNVLKRIQDKIKALYPELLRQFKI